jgi:hypothetical protein
MSYGHLYTVLYVPYLVAFPFPDIQLLKLLKYLECLLDTNEKTGGWPPLGQTGHRKDQEQSLEKED